ncbi:hypothetical protein PV05_05020 [Exophiala xenobiotica]|uniref:Uncharacterized protein n=1 Tax=Exophiala xenobiotica TaxID=348802 RepID=A0A0D2ENK8_9EURO|nr:uncharacterized protein PV05_05020 [Exophiala xenobiotica]KIW56355.1 hypothetical protein PV05_05020 [Exophiala xenobiotica]
MMTKSNRKPDVATSTIISGTQIPQTPQIPQASRDLQGGHRYRLVQCPVSSVKAKIPQHPFKFPLCSGSKTRGICARTSVMGVCFSALPHWLVQGVWMTSIDTSNSYSTFSRSDRQEIT